MSCTSGLPNVADKDSRQSVEITRSLLGMLGIDRVTDRTGQSEGTFLENGVRDFLAEVLAQISPERSWLVKRGQPIELFAQCSHLARLDEIVKKDKTGTLSTTIGRDYRVQPDVTVGIEADTEELPLLHASVSCKFTIRSDRVQNIRHEGVLLTRHRRGRQPHIVAVTSEPLPSQLAAIARGTGEVDEVYHVALDALLAATDSVGKSTQRDTLAELVDQRRLLDLKELPHRLTE